MPECSNMTVDMATETQDQPSPRCDHSRRKEDQLLYDGLDPSALGRMANDPSVRYQAELADTSFWVSELSIAKLSMSRATCPVERRVSGDSVFIRN